MAAVFGAYPAFQCKIRFLESLLLLEVRRIWCSGATEAGDVQAPVEKDAGISSYALQLLSIWGLMSYLKLVRQGMLEDAWSSNSIYQQIKSEMSRLETVLPEAHRFKNSRFHELPLSELEKHRHYWASWIFI